MDKLQKNQQICSQLCRKIQYTEIYNMDIKIRNFLNENNKRRITIVNFELLVDYSMRMIKKPLE